VTVTLISLPLGNCSLEFEPSDIERVIDCIKDLYPEAEAISYGMASSVRFAGCGFTFQNEWDDPCLISHSLIGAKHLRKIHAILTKI
jgi:hypothetical protein